MDIKYTFITAFIAYMPMTVVYLGLSLRDAFQKGFFAFIFQVI